MISLYVWETNVHRDMNTVNNKRITVCETGSHDTLNLLLKMFCQDSVEYLLNCLYK